MSELVVVVFPDLEKAEEGNRALQALHESGVAVYGSAVLYKGPDRKISVFDRVDRGSHATAVAALIGGLAGLPAGPVGAMIGAAGGALIGKSADITDRAVGNKLINRCVT